MSYRLLMMTALGMSISSLVFSQTTPVCFKGIIKDEEDNNPLNGVGVSSERYGYGTTSNAEGRFRMNMTPESGADTLSFSLLGYAPLKIAVKALDPKQENLIRIKREATTLPEVVIESPDPLAIIRKAISLIPVHYLKQPHLQKGFYRTATARDKEYIQLSEAAFDIFNYGYGKEQTSQFRLNKMRVLKDEKSTHGLDLGLRPAGLFEFDVINTVDHNAILSKNGLKKHRFRYNGEINFEGNEAYEITFDQRDGLKESLYKGVLYILKKDHVIVALNCCLSPKGIAYARYGDFATRALMGLLGLKIMVKSDSLALKYRKYGQQWLLSDVVEKNSLRFKSDRKQYDFSADITVNYITTGVDTVQKNPFTKEEVLSKNKFIEFQDAQATADFWNGYTVLLPDFPVEKVVAKIRSANESYRLKAKAQQAQEKLSASLSVRMDSLLSFYHRNGQFNGTVMVMQRGKPLLDKSYGWSDIERKTVADEHTQYRIGSLSKPFTATIILQLFVEGKLDTAATIDRYLPGYRQGKVTIAQLLSHTSGIPSYTNNPAYIKALLEAPVALPELVTRFCSDTLEFESGSRFAYSNSGYAILALIATIIEKKDFTAILKERIFDPAGMTDTYLGWNAGAEHAATGYLYDVPEPAYPAANMMGAGGITSSAEDLARWYSAMATGQLLPLKVMENMYRPRAVYTDWNAGYGYGWMIDQGLFAVSKNHRVIYHPGTDFGFYSMFVRLDDLESVIILLSNKGDFPRFDIADLLLTELQERG